MLSPAVAGLPTLQRTGSRVSPQRDIHGSVTCTDARHVRQMGPCLGASTAASVLPDRGVPCKATAWLGDLVGRLQTQSCQPFQPARGPTVATPEYPLLP